MRRLSKFHDEAHTSSGPFARACVKRLLCPQSTKFWSRRRGHIGRGSVNLLISTPHWNDSSVSRTIHTIKTSNGQRSYDRDVKPAKLASTGQCRSWGINSYAGKVLGTAWEMWRGAYAFLRGYGTQTILVRDLSRHAPLEILESCPQGSKRRTCT